MAADLVARLSGEDKLTPTLQKVKKELSDVGANSNKLDSIQKKFQKIDSSTAPLKKKLRDIKALMAEMNIDGLTDTEAFSIMAQQAGAYADALGDASQAVRQFADDNLNLNAATDAMTLVASTASVATGAMGLFGIENENVNEAILKVQSSLALLNGVQAIANVLNKDSALMLKLQALATTGATVTTTSFSAALTKNAIVEALATAKTKISTVVQIAWNVAKAIGMAMLGNFTGLALLAVGAVIGLTMATQSDTDATEEDNESKKKLTTTTEYLAEKSVEASNKINEEAGKLIASYKGLQTQFNSLGSDVEKSQWIEENKNQFQKLGFEIDNVTDAEDFFNKSSNAVITALQKRAKAAALYQLYLEALQKQYELNHQTTVHIEWSTEGSTEEVANNRQKAYDAAVAELQNGIKNQNDYVAQLEQDMIGAQQEYSNANAAVQRFAPKKRDNNTRSGGGSRGGNNKKVVLNPADDNNTLKFAQDMVKQIEDNLQTIPVTATADIDKAKADLLKWQKEVELRKLVITPEIGLPEGSLDYAKDMLSKAEDALNTIDLQLISPEDLQLALKQVDDWKKEVERREIKLGLKVVEPKESVASIVKPEDNKFFEKGSTEDLRQSLSNAKAIIEQIKNDYSDGLIDTDTAKTKINEVNEQLASLGLKEIVLHVEDDGSIMTAAEKLEEAQQKVDTILGAVDQFGSAFSNLGGAIDGTTGAVLSFAGTTISAIGQMLPQMASLIGGKFAEAMAVGTASGAALPFPANLAAIASIIATITAVATSAMSMKGKFADGGIIEGSSFHGDKMLARVNAGEMILNKAQQSNLYNALKNGNNIGGVGGGEVEFKISGSVLKGVLKNYDNKMKKLK